MHYIFLVRQAAVLVKGIHVRTQIGGERAVEGRQFFRNSRPLNLSLLFPRLVTLLTSVACSAIQPQTNRRNQGKCVTLLEMDGSV